MQHHLHQIVLFGDSITQMSFDPRLMGWGASLANAYQRKVDIVNRGFAGYNTAWALPVLEQLLPTVDEQRKNKTSILLTTVFLGANDAALLFANQHLPLEQYTANLNKILDLMVSESSRYYNPRMHVALITPPPLNEPQWEAHCIQQGGKLNRKASQTKLYAEAVRNVGNERGIVVVDLWTRLMELGRDNLSYFFTDGLHLNEHGNQILYELLLKTINTHFPDIAPDALEMELPEFNLLPKDNFNDLLQFPLLKK